MLRALKFSKKSLGITGTNPAVGAVVLDKNNNIVGVGRTNKPGFEHAEVDAINQAGSKAVDGTIIVTLEPCNHFGKTPPCTMKIISAKIKNVFYGVEDMTKIASGGGEFLKKNGINCVGGFQKKQISNTVLKPWLFRLKNNRPLISIKFAMTMDGYSAASDFSSKWITNETARNYAHKLRSKVGLIVVGASTVSKDNSRLSARKPSGELYKNQPRIAVLGREKINSNYKINNQKVSYFKNVDLNDFVSSDLETNQILVEGGPRLLAKFLDLDLVDEYFCFLSGDLLGNGINAITGSKITNINQKKLFNINKIKNFDGNFVIKGVKND